MDHSLDQLLLPLAVFAPLVAAVLLIFTRYLGSYSTKAVALIGFAIPALISLYLATQFSAATTVSGFAFLSDFDTGLADSLGISLKLGLNGISMPLFVLAGVVGLAAGLHAIQSKAPRLPLYLLLLLVMQGGLMGVFASVDIFFFYFFHEFALIATFIMVGIWGGQGRRTAAMELTIYLTLGAMLSLLGLIYLYLQADFTFDLIGIREAVARNSIPELIQQHIFGLLLFGFGILVSLFPFHSWAPRGYAAMPTATAMLHAGVLKKFGIYGLVQIAAPLVPAGAVHWSSLLIWLALGNILFIGLVTMAQRDLKQMIGYSSVMHMGYLFLGVATLSSVGIGGAVLLMVAHGLSVALLFLLATAIYNRTHTYDMQEMGGLGMRAPVLSGFFVAATMASIGLPGFANFWGELTIFVALWQSHPWALAPAVAGIVISAIYGLRAVSRIFFGSVTPAFQATVDSHPIKDITTGERLPASLLLVALLVIGCWPQVLTRSINQEVEQLPAFHQVSAPPQPSASPTLALTPSDPDRKEPPTS